MPAPVIAEYDPNWPVLADRWLARIADAAAPLPGSSDFLYDHIGSTAVRGLASKPILDLQLRAPELPDRDAFAGLLAPLGIVIAAGSRPDSPGVYADTPRPGADPDPAKYRKILFHRSCAAPEIILHVRRSDSPFAAFVLAFRDWLREDPAHAGEYERVKRELAQHYAAGDDYDDYTRAKTEFLDRIQPELDLA